MECKRTRTASVSGRAAVDVESVSFGSGSEANVVREPASNPSSNADGSKESNLRDRAGGVRGIRRELRPDKKSGRKNFELQRPQLPTYHDPEHGVALRAFPRSQCSDYGG